PPDALPIWAGNVAAGLALSERGRTASIGDWVTVGWNAGWFGGFTPGTVNNFSYTLIGNTMIINLALVCSKVPAAGPDLPVPPPGSAFPPYYCGGAAGLSSSAGAFGA